MSIEDIKRKIEKKTLFQMDYDALDDLIRAVYGHEYEFVAYEECSNYSSKSYKVVAEKPKPKRDLDNLNTFRITGKIGNWKTHLLLDDMCYLGIIEPGEYLIKVWW